MQQKQKKPPIPPMTPRRKQFFKMVSEGLRVGFEGQDISKVRSMGMGAQAGSFKTIPPSALLQMSASVASTGRCL